MILHQVEANEDDEAVEEEEGPRRLEEPKDCVGKLGSFEAVRAVVVGNRKEGTEEGSRTLEGTEAEEGNRSKRTTKVEGVEAAEGRSSGAEGEEVVSGTTREGVGEEARGNSGVRCTASAEAEAHSNLAAVAEGTMDNRSRRQDASEQEGSETVLLTTLVCEAVVEPPDERNRVCRLELVRPLVPSCERLRENRGRQCSST